MEVEKRRRVEKRCDDSSASEFNKEGQIKEIYLEDFMNHKKVLLTLGDKLNFITGENGAGKSAFVTALQVCLGGRSERSARLSGLIREGSSGPAIVRITLSNCGSDAYHPEVYGTSISIERKIYSSGACRYFIYSAEMEVINIKF